MFEIQLTPIIITLFSISVVCFLYLIFVFRHYVRSVGKKVKKDNESKFPSEPTSYPSVSVIVYSEDDAENLKILLPQILEQDYPSTFEVIVVNDGAVASTRDVIGRLEQRYSNLYMTFTPLESRSLSRKKLALTLGIKAARYEVLVFTTGISRIESREWLKTMTRHFIKGKEIVIGHATPMIPDDADNPSKRLHAFDSVRTSIKYLSWAIAGRPYRGNCDNLAYRRSIFFKNKGFSKSLHLKYGDDDIFINEVTNSHNTAVELSTASIVETYEPHPQREHQNRKLRYEYTSKSLKSSAPIFFGSFSLAWWTFLGCSVALSIVGLPSLLPLGISLILFLTLASVLSFSWRKTSRSIGSRPLLLTFTWFMTFEPIYNFYYKIKGFLTRNNNLTWN